MDAWVIFLSGMFIGMIIMGIIAAASNIRWSCRDGEEKKLDAWQQGVEQGYEIGVEHGKYEIMKGECIKKEDVIHLLERWADGYCYIEIPTDDAIKAIKEMGEEKKDENS